MQAYNFRMTLTDAPANRLPVGKPDGYDPQRYELLRRYVEAGVFDALDLNSPMPNRKTDVNNHGAFSSDHIGANYDYAEADRDGRERIFRDHVSYVMGLWYFLQNDERLPAAVREKAARWGLCRDEFKDSGHWPPQLYVREARRMTGEVVMTEHHCRGERKVEDPVGLAAYGMDSHNTQRYVLDGAARNEGDVQVGVPGPYPVSYRAIVPRRAEATNLLVPVALSASHIAYGSIRMEPVFMILAQSAATAASLALDGSAIVQDVPVRAAARAPAGRRPGPRLERRGVVAMRQSARANAFVVAAAVVVGAALACGPARPPAPPTPPPPPPTLGLDGQPDPRPDAAFVATIRKECATCHVLPAPGDVPRALWKQRLQDMKRFSLTGVGVPAGRGERSRDAGPRALRRLLRGARARGAARPRPVARRRGGPFRAPSPEPARRRPGPDPREHPLRRSRRGRNGSRSWPATWATASSSRATR